MQVLVSVAGLRCMCHQQVFSVVVLSSVCLQLGLALWVLTYVGAWFDGYTMLIIGAYA